MISLYYPPGDVDYPAPIPDFRHMLLLRSYCRRGVMLRPMCAIWKKTGYVMDEGEIEALYRQYGLDRPISCAVRFVDGQLSPER